MNILFLNVGRRCELVQEFKKVVPRLTSGGMIYGSDINPFAPALTKVDHAIIFPHSSHKFFLNTLIKTCSEYDIGLVIPTIDPDLKYLSRNLQFLKKQLPETLFLVPGLEVVEICEDKRKTKAFFENCGALVPQSLNPAEIENWPVFVKPACGSAGKGAIKVNDLATLKAQLKILKDPMVEEFIGGDEYTVDVFCDRGGRATMAVPRKRLAVRAGEVSRGIVVRNRALEQLAGKMAEKLKCDVPVTIQFRQTETGFVAMEINARMGGGLPLTIAAGGDWPLWILQMAKGIRPEFEDRVRNGVLMSRYDQGAFYNSVTKTVKKPDLAGVKLIIFDMDDTLYPEREFVLSGYKAVSKYVLKKYGVFIEDELQRRFSEGQRGDLFSTVFNDLGVPFTEEEIKALVAIYRNHRPRIRPYADAGLIKEFKKAGYKIALLSDGWKDVQKKKWHALGLQKNFDFTVFSDDFGLQFWKPHEKPFRYICEQAGVQPRDAVYIADNPFKDFIAPNKLAMHSLRIKRFKGEYSQALVEDKSMNAEYEIESISEALKLLNLNRTGVTHSSVKALQ